MCLGDSHDHLGMMSTGICGAGEGENGARLKCQRCSFELCGFKLQRSSHFTVFSLYKQMVFLRG